MRFLVDECTGASVVASLCEEGHDAVAVAELMPMADDEDVLARAVADDRILVTNDKDFGELVYRGGWKHRGILLLRLQDERAENTSTNGEDHLGARGGAIAKPLCSGH